MSFPTSRYSMSLHPDMHEHCSAIFERIMAGESFHNMEIDFVTKNGRVVPVEGNMTGRYLAGQFVATHGFFRDITERKRAEKLSEDYRQELERQVDVRTKELQEKNETLQQAQDQLVVQEKMASLGALTAGIAHEIKNPLNFVNNFAVLSSDLVKELGEEMEPFKAQLDADTPRSDQRYSR